MQYLIVPLLGIGVTALYYGITSLLAKRRTTALAQGKGAHFRVRLAGDRPPYPTKLTWGSLLVGPSTLVWTSLEKGHALDLGSTGIRPISVKQPRWQELQGAESMEITAIDGTGVPLRLVGGETAVSQLDELLRVRPLPDEPRPATVRQAERVAWWQRPSNILIAALLGLALLGAAGTAWAKTTGVRVIGSVTSSIDSDGRCTVQWVDPRDGRTLHKSMDCYDYSEGSQVDLLALGWPLQRVTIDPEDVWAVAGLSIFLTLTALGVWVVSRVRARRAGDAPTDAPTRRVRLVRASEDLSYAGTLSAMRARARAEGWNFDAAGGYRPPRWRSAGRRMQPWAVLVGQPLVLGAAVALGIGWSSLMGLWATAGETRTAVAIVGAVPDGHLPFMPLDLPVTYPVPDHAEPDTTVPVLGLPNPPPGTLRIAYDVHHPSHARALQYDGAPRGAARAAVPFLLGVGFAGFGAWHVITRSRRQGSGGTATLRYVLAPGPGGRPLMLLFGKGANQPAGHYVELGQDLRGRIPGAGMVELRGRFVPGEEVVPLIDGTPLETSSPLSELDPQHLRLLLNSAR